MDQNSSVDINSAGVYVGLKKLWPILPGYMYTWILPSGWHVCFIRKVWLVTLTNENTLASNTQHVASLSSSQWRNYAHWVNQNCCQILMKSWLFICKIIFLCTTCKASARHSIRKLLDPQLNTITSPSVLVSRLGEGSKLDWLWKFDLKVESERGLGLGMRLEVDMGAVLESELGQKGR